MYVSSESKKSPKPNSVTIRNSDAITLVNEKTKPSKQCEKVHRHAICCTLKTIVAFIKLTEL